MPGSVKAWLCLLRVRLLKLIGTAQSEFKVVGDLDHKTSPVGGARVPGTLHQMMMMSWGQTGACLGQVMDAMGLW